MSLPPHIDLAQNSLQSEQEFFEALLEGELAESTIAHGLQIKSSEIKNANLSAAKLIKADFRELTIHNSTFVGTSLSEGSIERSTVTNCRLTGLILSEGRLEDCTIKNSAVNMALFRFTSLKNVHFIDCNLQGADFYQATLRKVRFENCNLEGVDFSRAKMNQVDLRGSQLFNLRGITDLKGATISSDQLIYLAYPLATEIGITIAD